MMSSINIQIIYIILHKRTETEVEDIFLPSAANTDCV